MEIHTHIGGWGGSKALRLPKAMAEELAIEEGSKVSLTVENGALIVRPAKAAYTLEELVKQAQGHTPPEIVDDEPVGVEWPAY